MGRFLLAMILVGPLWAGSPPTPLPARWTEARAQDWQARQGWLVGTNYIPASAVNPLEMWQADTFDPAAIDRELGWAQDLGMNCQRVFLHYLAWKPDPQGFFSRVDRFLDLAAAHGQKIVFVLNDSVWNPDPHVGPQPAPVPRHHNSGWVQSPGAAVLRDPVALETVGTYIKEVLARYGHDPRVILWDLLNEPDNGNGDRFRTEPRFKGPLAYRLLTKSFAWAREVAPDQPLTAGLWTGDWTDPEVMGAFNLFQTDNSDVITFHSYEGPDGLGSRVAQVLSYGRPVLCTEYMARPLGSTFEACLPLLKQARIGALNWGFVEGKTNTKFAWDSWDRDYPDDPTPWFHDILRSDGTPWDPRETKFIREITGSR
ncbi:MAG TPA: endo-1,4-beta-xylanase [Spirochaetia bacterium]|nr:endo-1,4-beta-xylanase [Spirochaetia bacterium]